MDCPVLSRSEAVSLLEVAHKMAVVAKAHPNHNLLHIQESVLQKPSGFEQAEFFLILHGRHADL